jgi:hypothetical protein
VFSTACGRVPYEVTGTVADDERSVTLEGDAPLLSQGCTGRSTKHDELHFELVER